MSRLRLGLLCAGAGLAALGLAATLRTEEPAAPDFAPAPAPAAAAPAPVDPPSPPVEPPAALPAADAGQASGTDLKLHGLLADAALIGYPDGRQRLVRIGREAEPGLRLDEVAQHHALLSGAAGPVRLTFGGGGAPAQPAGPATSAPSPAPPAEASNRLAFEPRRDGGRIRGFALRPGVRVPLLEQAGLRAGDVVLKVDSSGFDSEERVLELSRDLAGAGEAEIEFERGGRRMTATLRGNR